MLREKIKEKAFLFAVITTIIIGFIAAFSNQDTIMNFALHNDSGEDETALTLERKAFNEIEWCFVSTSDVDLLIIAKSTLEYFEDVASEISSQFGQDYNQLMEQFLEDEYVSRDKQQDSGKFYVHSSGVHVIKFDTGGFITYTVKCDPFVIDLIWIFYGILGISTTIGIIYSFNNMKELIKMKPNNDKDSIDHESYHKFCERCGALLEIDSLFCHECGIILNKSI
ncbi:MAG: hypothetical protein ACFE8L_09565 [Candidatus Hodarchaeota archaeon]